MVAIALAVLGLVGLDLTRTAGNGGAPTPRGLAAAPTGVGAPGTYGAARHDDLSYSRPVSTDRPLLETRPGIPRTVHLPAIGVRADVVRIEAAGGVLTPPADARTVGWWSGGAEAGARRGSVLVTGHTVRAGGGAFDDLETAQKGSLARVVTDQGTHDYRVISVRVLSKQQLAEQAAELFDPRGAAQLVLVTCEDWDGTSYRSNVVVLAEPRRAPG